MNVRRMLYYGLTYPLLAYGIVVWEHSAKALTRGIFILQKKGCKVYSRVKTTGIMYAQTVLGN
jgi:hypothetical protein